MNEIETFFETQIDEHQRIVKRCKDILMDSFSNALEICVESLKAKNKILFFGNGGSASDAQHLSTELAVRFAKNRKAIPSLSLVTDTSALTAIGNDFGFDQFGFDEFGFDQCKNYYDKCSRRSQKRYPN